MREARQVGGGEDDGKAVRDEVVAPADARRRDGVDDVVGGAVLRGLERGGVRVMARGGERAPERGERRRFQRDDDLGQTALLRTESVTRERRGGDRRTEEGEDDSQNADERT
ncbi:MAG: hypothetical protein JO064_11510 [Actinobacteria bacterium]|nr:hypothetical protein [Actinomycetota bacterium]